MQPSRQVDVTALVLTAMTNVALGCLDVWTVVLISLQKEKRRPLQPPGGGLTAGQQT